MRFNKSNILKFKISNIYQSLRQVLNKMSLSAYSFQFYSYNMPSYRPGAIIHNDSMDVDDIDLSLPPPKPPRAAALQQMLANGGSIGNISQHSWTTSTPKLPQPATDMMTKPEPKLIKPVNYFTDGNETPKSIYSSGHPGTVITANTSAATLSTEMHQPIQKRWSHELRAKALEMSKHSSGSIEEESTSIQDDSLTSTNEEVIEPQSHSGYKSWSCQIREKALEMSKRNASKYVGEAKQTNIGNPQHDETVQHKNSNDADLTSIVFAEHEKNSLNSTFTSSLSNIDNSSLSSTVEDCGLSQNSLKSVKDRISYFNTLTSVGNRTFINLLKNSKTQARATLNQTSSSSYSNNGLNTQFSTPAKPKRWSTHINLHLDQPTIPGVTDKPSNFWQANASSSSSSTTTSNSATSMPKFSTFSSFQEASSNVDLFNTSYNDAITTSTSSFANNCNISGSASFTTNTPIQRKSSLRRKPSIEKSRRPIQRQNSTSGNGNGSNGGTKPQMHAVMEDLSLVMPVKLRVAEYERRIMMES